MNIYNVCHTNFNIPSWNLSLFIAVSVKAEWKLLQVHHVCLNKSGICFIGLLPYTTSWPCIKWFWFHSLLLIWHVCVLLLLTVINWNIRGWHDLLCCNVHSKFREHWAVGSKLMKCACLLLHVCLSTCNSKLDKQIFLRFCIREFTRIC
jgi:hypothetical protein